MSNRNGILKVVFLVMLTCFSAGSIISQTGLILDDPTYDEVPVLPRYNGSKYRSLTPIYSLRSYTPFPGDQGDMGSCVGWAAGYGAMTTARAIAYGLKGKRSAITEMAHSALFIYNQIVLDEGDCESGSRLSDAMRLLQEKGDCFAITFDDPFADCGTLPDSTPVREANEFKIKTFARLFDGRSEAKTILTKVKESIASNQPVVVGVIVHEDFFNIPAGTKIYTPDTTSSSFGHAMVATGYNEVTREIELMNSFGMVWGDSGFINVSYEYFTSNCKFGYQFIPDEHSTQLSLDAMQLYLKDRSNEDLVFGAARKSPILKGNFQMRIPTGIATDKNENELYDQEGDPILNFDFPELVQKREGLYELKKDYPIGTNFQLVAKEIAVGSFVYVFSVDAADKLRIHWPIEEKNENNLVANYIPSIDAEIIIPEKMGALQLTVPGADRLCILFSTNKIINFNTLVNEATAMPGELYENLQKVFNEVVDMKEVTREPDAMKFSVPVQQNKSTIVPLVLVVRSQKKED